jgi:type I restriction enzyme R subunit
LRRRRSGTSPAVLQRIGEVLDRSIEGVHLGPAIDLSRIDFKTLAAKFKNSNTKNLDLARLKAAIRAQLDRLIAINETASISARSSSP